jgi:predicted DNA-binding protein YlxM (UPF0122 family)
MTKGKFLFLVFAIFLFILVLPLTYSALDKYGHLKVTSEHPFLVDKEWISASELQEGDILETSRGERVKITNIEDVQEKEIFEVYNMHVSGPETFFADDILVHNKAMPRRYGLDDPEFGPGDVYYKDWDDVEVESYEIPTRDSEVACCHNPDSPDYYKYAPNPDVDINDLGPRWAKGEIKDPYLSEQVKDEIWVYILKKVRQNAKKGYIRWRRVFQKAGVSEEDIVDFAIEAMYRNDIPGRFKENLKDWSVHGGYKGYLDYFSATYVRGSVQHYSSYGIKSPRNLFYRSKQSLNSPVGSGESTTMGDLLPDYLLRNHNPQQVIRTVRNDKCVREIFDEALAVLRKDSTLEIHEIEAFELYYHKGLTLEEIGKMHGKTKQAVSIWLKNSVEFLANNPEMSGLFEVMDVNVEVREFFDLIKRYNHLIE